MPTQTLVIAIDGPAASGKSTTARRVAERLGYTYIDTGAMYRAVTLAALRRGLDPSDEAAVSALANALQIAFVRNPGTGNLQTLLDSEDVSQEIRTPQVTRNVSLVSSYAGVRGPVVALQQRMGEQGGVVMDGRDIGTVVFPNADLKIFMVANLDARAARRHVELQHQGTAIGLDNLANELAERDRQDSTRHHSPLRKADDAVEIDTSGLTIEEQVEKVLALVASRQAQHQQNEHQ